MIVQRLQEPSTALNLHSVEYVTSIVLMVYKPQISSYAWKSHVGELIQGLINIYSCAWPRTVHYNLLVGCSFIGRQYSIVLQPRMPPYSFIHITYDALLCRRRGTEIRVNDVLWSWVHDRIFYSKGLTQLPSCKKKAAICCRPGCFISSLRRSVGSSRR